MAKLLSRRAVLGGIGLATLPGAAFATLVFEDRDPTDLVPRRYTPKAFAELDEHDLHMTVLAVRRGRRITIDGCSASESRAIIRTAASDRAAALRMMQARCR